MRISDALSCIVNDELRSRSQLSQAEISTSPERNWYWIHLIFNTLDNSTIQALLQDLSPMQSGEIVDISSEDFLYYSPEGLPPQRTSKDIVLQEPIRATLPMHLHQILSPDYKSPQPAIRLRLRCSEEPIDADSIALEIQAKTWIGSRILPPNFAQRSFRLTVGAQQKIVRPEKQEPIVGFSFDEGYFAGFLTNNPLRKVQFRLYCYDGMQYTIEYDQSMFLKAINFPGEESYGFDVTIPLEFDAILPRSIDHNTILQALQDAMQVHEKICELVRERLNFTKQQILERLEQRRRTLRLRRHVYLNSGYEQTDLGPEPTNETETLIFTGKLEQVLGKEFGEFKILEHTSQLGIDGLIRIRRNRESAVEEDAIVEFEYELANFFRHRHPIYQTNYIICWSLGSLDDGEIRFGESGIQHNGPFSVQMRPFNWMKVLVFGNHIIHVIPLQKLPQISIHNK